MEHAAVDGRLSFWTEPLTLRFGVFYQQEKQSVLEGKLFDPFGQSQGVMLQFDGPLEFQGWNASMELRPVRFVSLWIWYSRHSSESLRARLSEVLQGLNLFYNPHPFLREESVRSILALHSAGVDHFEDEGVYLLGTCSATSGSPFTLVQAPQNLGQSTAWNIGVRALIDLRTRIPTTNDPTETTPYLWQVNLRAGVIFTLAGWTSEAYVHITNLFNRANVFNVYPTTGEPNEDGWLQSPYAVAYKQVPNYEAFYRAINLDNRWAYMQSTGRDIYGEPRQFRLGLRVRF